MIILDLEWKKFYLTMDKGRRIKSYPLDNAIGFPNTYPLDSNLSGGERYTTFEQPGPVE